MHKSVCVKNPDAITLRDCFGATALSTVNGLCTVFMSSMFMQYMTDYAGLGAMGRPWPHRFFCLRGSLMPWMIPFRDF